VQIKKGPSHSQGSSSRTPQSGKWQVCSCRGRHFAATGVSNRSWYAITNAGRHRRGRCKFQTFRIRSEHHGHFVRTHAYPSITTDMFGFVYVAFLGEGLGPVADALVVAACSIDGRTGTPALMVDISEANRRPSFRSCPSSCGNYLCQWRLPILTTMLRYAHYVNFFYTPGTPLELILPCDPRVNCRPLFNP